MSVPLALQTERALNTKLIEVGAVGRLVHRAEDSNYCEEV